MLDTIVEHPNHPLGPPVKRSQEDKANGQGQRATCTRKRRTLVHPVSLSCAVPGPPGSRSYSTPRPHVRARCQLRVPPVFCATTPRIEQKTLADHCGAKSASTPKLQGPRPSARPRRSAEYGRDTLPKGPAEYPDCRVIPLQPCSVGVQY
jgi:hypothetical protein